MRSILPSKSQKNPRVYSGSIKKLKVGLAFASIVVLAIAILGIAQQQGGGGGGGGTSGGTTSAFATGTDSGAVNAYVVSNLSPAMTAYTFGNVGCFKVSANNTTTNPTVNFNGLGTKTVVRLNNVVLSGGDMTTNEPSCLIYDGANFLLLNPVNSSGGGGFVLTNGPVFLASITSPLYRTTTKCAANGTAASPSVVSCVAAPAGVFSCDDTTAGLCTVNTTAMITANSTVMVTQDISTTTGTLLTVTCNTTVSVINPSTITAKVAATSFSFTMTTPVTNPDCFQYLIVN